MVFWLYGSPKTLFQNIYPDMYQSRTEKVSNFFLFVLFSMFRISFSTLLHKSDVFYFSSPSPSHSCGGPLNQSIILFIYFLLPLNLLNPCVCVSLCVRADPIEPGVRHNTGKCFGHSSLSVGSTAPGFQFAASFLCCATLDIRANNRFIHYLFPQNYSQLLGSRELRSEESVCHAFRQIFVYLKHLTLNTLKTHRNLHMSYISYIK